MLENPYSLHPAIGKDFIGRGDILTAWRDRLTLGSDPWESAKSWMVVGAGGMGKTSLLHELIRIANDEFKAHTISIDLGRLREIGDIGDLFATLSVEMPKAKRVGTKLRKWFGLQPNAPISDLVGQITGELLNQVTGFAIGLTGGGVKIGNFRQKPSELEGTAHRLAQFLVNLSILSEEQESPVIVFLDQIGKCYDHPTWTYIAGMFLALCKKMRFASVSQIFFVVSLRPEQEGRLRHQIDRRLFEHDIFIPIDLYPLSIDEAINAITVRGGAYISKNLAKQIITKINHQGPLDPYTIQLSSMAVWNYITGNEGWHSPMELETDTERLHGIIQQGHAEIVHPFMQDPILWDILVLLSQSPSGLTTSQIHNRLSQEHNLSTSEIQIAINRLLNPPRTGYRLLTEVRQANSLNLYMLAHDLLRDYILSIIPEDQRLVHQVNIFLETGLWRYQRAGVLLSDWELQLLWEVHPYIILKAEHWGLIISSEIPLMNQRLLYWLRNYSKEVYAVLRNNYPWKVRDFSAIRLNLFSLFVGSLSGQSEDTETALSILRELAQFKDRNVRSCAVEAIGQLGEAALPTLRELAQLKDRNVRSRAVEAIGQLGEIALPTLRELAQLKDRNIRLCAIDAIGQLGEAALPTLRELVQDNDIDVRWRIMEALEQLGDTETALLILSELAQDKDAKVRLRAGEAFARRADTEIGLLILAELAQDKNIDVRLHAVEILAEFGVTETAMLILPELAQDKDKKVRLRAVKALTQIAYTDMGSPIMAELTQDKDIDVRLRVAETLAQLGDSETALPILRELTQDKAIGIRLRAVDALSQLGETALPTLRELAQSQIRKVRLRTVKALVRLGEIALPTLRELAQHRNRNVRLYAAEALAQLGEIETALPTLHKLTQDKGIVVRLHAAEALAQLGEIETALLTLRELTQAKDRNVRLHATKVLTQLGDTETALSILRELAEDSDKVIRWRAVEGLGQLGKMADQELFFIAVAEPLDEPRALAAIMLIMNDLSEYFPKTHKTQ